MEFLQKAILGTLLKSGPCLLGIVPFSTHNIFRNAIFL